MRDEILANVHATAISEETDVRYRLAAAKVIASLDMVNVRREAIDEDTRHNETMEQLAQFRTAMASSGIQDAIAGIAADGLIAGEVLAKPDAENARLTQDDYTKGISERDALGTEPSASTMADSLKESELELHAKPDPIDDGATAVGDVAVPLAYASYGNDDGPAAKPKKRRSGKGKFRREGQADGGKHPLPPA